MTIRRATMHDCVPILILVEEFYEYGKVEKILGQPWNEKVMFDLVRFAIQAYPDYLTLVLEEEGIQGVLIADKGYFLGIPTFRLCEEVVWYVRPEYRKGPTIKKMIHAFEDWARAEGALAVSMGSAQTIGGDKTDRALSYLGYYKGITLHYKQMKGETHG